MRSGFRLRAQNARNPAQLAVPAMKQIFEMEKACRFEPFSLQQFALEHKFKTVVEI
jgi:hypothetical protein